MITVVAQTLDLSPLQEASSASYRIGDVPEVRAKYVEQGGDAKAIVRVDLLNQRSAYRAKFYEAVGTLNNFTAPVEVGFGVDTLDFDHSAGTESNNAYKYKVSYFIEGNIGGTPVEFEGSKSEPVYLLGRQTSL